MSDALVIDHAERADLPAVLALYAQPDMDDGRVLDVAAAEAIHARMQRYPDYRLYVARRDRAIVGSYALLVMDNLGHMGARSAIIEDVVVDPARQGQGIGRAMMRHAEAAAAAANCYKLMLSSNARRTSAHAFYESLGFVRHGISFRLNTPNSRDWGNTGSR